jgi:hypothetical protein
VPDALLLIAAAAVAAAALYLATRRPRPPAFADAREERLARRLARQVGCRVDDVLPAVRREVNLAPGQSDETLLKRATYHYQRGLPEGPCPVYRDRAPG